MQTYTVLNMKKILTHWLNNLWYQPKAPQWGWCLSEVYGLLQKSHAKWIKPQKSLLPVIVVGNLSVGGTGKTPVVIAIAKQLSAMGIRVGIITRGYKSQNRKTPYLVTAMDDAKDVGDEALLIARKTKLPVVISAKRYQALRFLHQHQQCDVVLSDDGLQHYALPRALEIVVIDGERGFGNHELLPMGPLREPLSRLEKVDFIVVNGEMSDSLRKSLEKHQAKTFHLSLVAQDIYAHSEHSMLFNPNEGPFAALAGIGHPERFFKHLKSLNLDIQCYPFPDHHHFEKKDFQVLEKSIIMTEKDAIKCPKVGTKPIFVLPVEAQFQSSFWPFFLTAVQELYRC